MSPQRTRSQAWTTNRSVDLGMAFTYTGCGGRDLKGTKQNPKNLRTAPQTSHQTFDNPLNAALKVSLSPLVLALKRDADSSARPRRNCLYA